MPEPKKEFTGWKRFADFQGPTETEERQVFNAHTVRGKAFKRGKPDPLIQGTGKVDPSGVWGHGHRNLGGRS